MFGYCVLLKKKANKASPDHLQKLQGEDQRYETLFESMDPGSRYIHHSINAEELVITGLAKPNVQNGLRLFVRRRVCVAS